MNFCWAWVPGVEAGRLMEQQHGLGGAAAGAAGAAAWAGPGLGAALLGEQAGPEMDEEAFSALSRQADRGETAAVLAAVDQDKRLATSASATHGLTLLHWSCFGGRQELAGALLVRGADVLAKTSGGYDACSYACDLALVALLLDKGASPHTRIPNDYSCVSRAAVLDHLPVVLLLISKGADLVEPTRDNRTALEWWGENKEGPPLSPAELASRRAEALAAFRAGPHPREVQRRKGERWARRWAFVQVAVGCGYLPLEARRLAQSLARASLGPAAAAADFLPVVLDTAEKRRAYRLLEILSNVDLARRVASFL